MSIDTEITGSPGGIEGAATWLRTSLEPRLTAAADAANGARRDAETGWSSVAGEEFVDTARRIRDSSDDLAGAAKKMAGDLDDFAGKLRRSQDQMGDVRSTARGAGLTVSGFTVQHPGDGPARPPDLFEGTPQEVEAHNQRVTAYDAHQDLLQAYYDAEAEAARIDRYYAAACRELQEEYLPGTHASWIVTLSDIVGDSAAGVIGATIALRQSRLLQSASDLVDEASRAIDDLQAHPERYMKRKWFFFQTLDEARLEADRLAIQGRLDEAEDLLRQSQEVADSRALRYLGRAGKVLGPLGIGLGVHNDWQEGETTEQILVSQGVSAGLGAAAGYGAGLAASVGTAALIGATAGSVVPGVGTAVGAVVGTVVGAGIAIFADGAIDSLFENGPDVGAAWDEGVDALEDTGEAIADGVSSVGETIGGWFSLSTRPRIGKVSAALGVGSGLLAVALGVGLVQEAETGFGLAWAASFVVFGVVSLLGVVAATRPPERGSPWARPLALVVLLLLAGWAVVTAVVGVVEENWLWGVLLGVPAAYLLWAAARVWRSDPDDAAARRP